MIRMFRAELLKLRRPRILIASALPGLLLEELSSGGTPGVSFSRTVLVLAVFVAAAATAAALTFQRRDLTA